jgi:hypothetical protein
LISLSCLFAYMFPSLRPCKVDEYLNFS